MAAEPIYEVGDIVFTRVDIFNDGGIPDLAEEALVAPAGARGVVVRHGHAQMDDQQSIYLVCFTRNDSLADLGPPVGCLEDELTQEVESAHGPAA